MTVTISRKQITPTVTITPSSYEYTGSAIQPSGSAVKVLDGTDEIPASEYTLSYGENIHYGTGTVTVKDNGVGNYEITETSKDFTITKPSLETATVNLSPTSYTYDGTPKTPTVTVTKGSSPVDANEYVISYSNTNGGAGDHTNAGTVTVTVTAKENGDYYGSCSKTFVIEPKAITAVVTAENKTYDGTPSATVTASVNSGDLASGDNITITNVTGTFDNANAGTGKVVTVNSSNAVITGNEKSNYAITIPATTSANIEKATVTITWGSDTQTKTYTGKTAEITAPTVSAENGLTVSVDPVYSYKAEGETTFTNCLPTNAGTYTVRASTVEDGNLTAASADMTLTINKAPLTITGATVTPRPYEADNTTAFISSVAFSGLVNGETLTINTDYTATGAFDNSDAGEDKSVTVTVTLSDTTKANNYTLDSGTFTTTGEIEKANSTITTAPTATGIIYGQALSDSTLSGGAGSVPGTFEWTDGSTKPSAGTAQYEVTFTPTDANYNTATANVSVTVAKATPNLTPPTAVTIEYGQKLSDSTLTDGSVTVAGKWSWASGSTQPTVTGDFPAAFTPTDTANYETPANVDVSVIVNPATPEITVTVPSYQVANEKVTVVCEVKNPHDATKDDLPAVTLTYTILSFRKNQQEENGSKRKSKRHS